MRFSIFSEKTGNDNPLNGADVGYNSKPIFADIDGDGDMDAFMGEYDGTINYYQNTGSSTTATFTVQADADALFDSDVGTNSAPTFVDIDKDGDLDVFIGAGNGIIQYYKNIGSNAAHSFSPQVGNDNPLNAVDVGEGDNANATPAFVVRGIRSRIEEFGGEIRFETRMERLLLERRTASHLEDKLFQVLGLKLADGSTINTQNVILALGHSARDTFESLESVGVKIEQKLFSVGFRIEHKQSLIDRDRWGGMVGHPQLGHAEYKLVHHASNGRCVYSFCMCPGGLVVGATSEKDCVVTNGMSQPLAMSAMLIVL